jgi:nucleoside-diphosphate-sugar epimerase
MGAIFLAGHRGMVGQAIHRRLQAEGAEVLTADRAELDLRDGAAVGAFLAQHRPSQVILAAAKVGGIHANNTYPADFLFDNLAIQNSVIQGAFAAGVQQLLFLGSSCIYPRDAAQPMKEDALLTGPLEPTNEPYALAKIAGIKLCESYNRQHGTDYRAVMPTNLYGPFDNFHPENSHVLPALLRRFHEAKLAKAPEVVVWGSGTPMREFLHVDDMAEASLHVLRLDRAAYEAHTQPMQRHVNVGTGVDVTIRELAEQVAAVVGYEGQLTFDASKPDGTPRKLLDVSLLAQLGWRAHIGLREGLAETYAWFCEQSGTLRLG